MPGNLTQERLKQLLHYEPSTGVFTWIVRPCKKYRAGTVAGCKHPNGYVRIVVGGNLRLAHRLAWLYVYAEFPSAVIDHINRVRDDNRIANLREATWAENQQNRQVNKNSTSGVSGVTWDKRNAKWRAHIMLNGRTLHLGRYCTIEDATKARAAHETQLFTHAIQQGVAA